MTETQIAISELLRSADKVIKSGNLEEAIHIIDKVFDLDQRNVYAKAYKERIFSLMESRGSTKSEVVRNNPASIQQKAVSIPSPIEKPVPTHIKSKKSDAGESDRAKQKSDPVVERTQNEKQMIMHESTSPATVDPKKNQVTIKRTVAAQEAYRSMLLEIWKDGSISSDEQLRIDSMRETFAISQEEHNEIENDVRVTAYMNAIRDAWKKGITNFEPLRKKFSISDQDQISLEPKVMQLLQSLRSNGSILVMDDDTAFLSVIKDILNDGGFYCFTAISGEEALKLLDTMTPDIVICDINFQKPHMSGFAFYEKFRSIDKYLSTPFIFLSGLDQEVLIRTGKKLGADDYLTKPVDAEMLIATVEGKLRRSRELRRQYE